MKVEVRIHKEDLIKVVEVSDEVFTDFGDQPSNTEIRKFLLEQLEDEYKQVGTKVWIDAYVEKENPSKDYNGGLVFIQRLGQYENQPDMKVSKKNNLSSNKEISQKN